MTRASGLSPLKDFAVRFQERHGHRLRILHIGNIANNAYNNAALLNASGYDCDVICYDYYHLMGCPEWEDAEFDSSTLEQNRPDWRTVSLNGYQRPEWFAQGPKLLCIDYLLARRLGQKKKAATLWGSLSIASRLASTPIPDAQSPLEVVILAAMKLSQRAYHLLRRIMGYAWVILFAHDGELLIRKKIELLLSNRGIWSAALRGCISVGVSAIMMPNRALRHFPAVFSRRRRRVEELIVSLIDKYKTHFPTRKDSLTREDIATYLGTLGPWAKLLSNYDLVIGYATDPILPCLIGKRPFIAYEHGTIRDIPFQATAVGRLTALAYAEADVVFLTNADSVASAKNLRAAKMVFGLHGFNGDHLQRRIERARNTGADLRFKRADGAKVFFGPSRQHWKQGFATWLKGNDQVIRAVERLTKTHPRRFVVVFVEWGAEVAESKQLIHDLGVEEYCAWVPPKTKIELLRAYLSVNCVIDQFILPCLGSVTLEAIAVGECPVITRLDDQAMAYFYGETIPLLNCTDYQSIAAAMAFVINDDSSSRRIAQDSKKWFDKHHSTAKLESTLLETIAPACTL